MATIMEVVVLLMEVLVVVMGVVMVVMVVLVVVLVVNGVFKEEQVLEEDIQVEQVRMEIKVEVEVLITLVQTKIILQESIQVMV